VSIFGVYGGYLDWVPMGPAINRGLTFRMAQTPVQHYMPLLRITKGEIDPSFVITDRGRLEDGPDLYKKFSRSKRWLHQKDSGWRSIQESVTHF
jgi:threonine dehydrogenase-like Zn-dependent dehydrogenase